MSEQHKAIARRFIDAFVAGDSAALEEGIVEDFADHNPLPGQGAGRGGLIQALAGWNAAFPDLTIKVEHEIAEDEALSFRILRQVFAL